MPFQTEKRLQQSSEKQFCKPNSSRNRNPNEEIIDVTQIQKELDQLSISNEQHNAKNKYKPQQPSQTNSISQYIKLVRIGSVFTLIFSRQPSNTCQIPEIIHQQELIDD